MDDDAPPLTAQSSTSFLVRHRRSSVGSYVYLGHVTFGSRVYVISLHTYLVDACQNLKLYEILHIISLHTCLVDDSVVTLVAL
jgi:hypothetical protein